MSNCAVVRLDDSVVINIIVALPSDLPPNDCELIEIVEGQRCNIGWTWDGTTFIDPGDQ